MKNSVKVVAIQRGWFGGEIRQIGDKFSVSEAQLSKEWMKVLTSQKNEEKYPEGVAIEKAKKEAEEKAERDKTEKVNAKKKLMRRKNKGVL